MTGGSEMRGEEGSGYWLSQSLSIACHDKKIVPALSAAKFSCTYLNYL